MAATWLVSFDRIRRSDPAAADLLFFMSYIENKAIPRSILPSMETEERMVHAIGTLRAYAFVTEQGNGDTYDVHRLVHLATKVWLSKHGATMELDEKVSAHLAEVFPSDDYENQALWRAYLPHGLQFLNSTKAQDSKSRYDVCMAVGNCLCFDGRIREAVTWFSARFLWSEGHFAKDHPYRLASQRALAISYGRNGQIEDSVELLEHIVAIEEKVLREDHHDRLVSQHTLAVLYQANGQTEKAFKLFEKVVAIWEKVLKEDHPDRLVSQHELAISYRANGQTEGN
ncbi:MAG: hypothetical protein Q9163_002459 [Psora crenata]